MRTGTRKERRLERYEQIRSRMGDDDLKALVMMIEDDKQRSILIKELIEKTVDEGAFQGARAWLHKVTDPDSGRVGYVTRGTGPAP